MIVEICHRTDPTIPATCAAACEACKQLGPPVEQWPDDPTGPSRAVEAAVAAGWREHQEPVVTPVLKLRRAAHCEQAFCPACVAAGKVGQYPHYTRSHKKKPSPGAS